MSFEAHDSRLQPQPARAPKYQRLVQAVESGIDAPGCFGRHVKQRDRTPRSTFYNAKQHRGPKFNRAVGPGSYSELDIAVGRFLDGEIIDGFGRSPKHYPVHSFRKMAENLFREGEHHEIA